VSASLAESSLTISEVMVTTVHGGDRGVVGPCPRQSRPPMPLPGWLAAIERGQLTEAAAAQLCARLLQPAAGCVGETGPRALTRARTRAPHARTHARASRATLPLPHPPPAGHR
jgi:hypothetical protein